jgi:hypothetical protein
VDHGAESRCHGGSTYALLMPPRCRFGAKIHDAETCYLGAMFHSAKLRIHFLKSFHQGCICGILSRKGLKNKKSGATKHQRLLIISLSAAPLQENSGFVSYHKWVCNLSPLPTYTSFSDWWEKICSKISGLLYKELTLL